MSSSITQLHTEVYLGKKIFFAYILRHSIAMSSTSNDTMCALKYKILAMGQGPKLQRKCGVYEIALRHSIAKVSTTLESVGDDSLCSPKTSSIHSTFTITLMVDLPSESRKPSLNLLSRRFFGHRVISAS